MTSMYGIMNIESKRVSDITLVIYGITWVIYEALIIGECGNI